MDARRACNIAEDCEIRMINFVKSYKKAGEICKSPSRLMGNATGRRAARPKLPVHVRNG